MEEENGDVDERGGRQGRAKQWEDLTLTVVVEGTRGVNTAAYAVAAIDTFDLWCSFVFFSICNAWFGLSGAVMRFSLLYFGHRFICWHVDRVEILIGWFSIWNPRLRDL